MSLLTALPSVSHQSSTYQNRPQQQGAVNANQLLELVRPGLQLVEAKMKSVDSALFAPLANAFLDLIGSGGKRLRPALALMTAEVKGQMAEHLDYHTVVALAAAVEMLHTSSLVHDDVIDGAMLRRGAPTLNALWNGGSTVLAGDYMFGSAAFFSAETQNLRVIRLFSDTLKIIVDGELRQLRDRYNFEQEKSAYYQRIYAKTASLFCAATEGAAILAGFSEADVKRLRNYGYCFGMAFQIMDDVLDFTSDEATLGKPAGSDLLQGTLTLPFFYFLRQQPDQTALIARLEEQRTQVNAEGASVWPSVVADLVIALRAGNAAGEARQEALTFLAQAKAALEPFPANPFKDAMIGLCDFVVQRSY
jgi:geranylgeranyl pyrophosphate synthase